MSNITERIEEICHRADSENISESIGLIQNCLKEMLVDIINESELNNSQKRAAMSVCNSWNFPLSWELEINPKLCKVNNANYMGIGVDVVLKVKDIEGIEENINAYFENIKKLLSNNGFFRLPPIAMVDKLQKYLRDIRLEGDATSQKSEERIREVLNNFFGMKVLDYTPEKNLEHFFDFPESISAVHSKTTVPAIVRNSTEGDKEVLKGIYVIGNSDKSI